MPDIVRNGSDPRIRRTRLLLQQALLALLKEKAFEDISIQDISEASTINRATFYAHYNDKSALLECTIGTQFSALLKKREVIFDGTCPSALKAMTLSLCDYLVEATQVGTAAVPQLSPYMESAIVSVLRQKILDGLRQHPSGSLLSAEITSATISWALYGAAKEWLQTPHRSDAEPFADLVVALISPLMKPLTDVARSDATQS